MSREGLKLNLGCGGQIVDGWVNVDRAFPPADVGEPPTMVHDLNEPLPFASASAEQVVTHHVLDLLTPRAALALMGEVHRVLEPGGVWRISSFDLMMAGQRAANLDRDWFISKGAPPPMTITEQFEWLVYQGGARKWFMLPATLESSLVEHGFLAGRCEYRRTAAADRSIVDLDSRPDESFYLEAHKS